MARINDYDIKSKNVPLYGWGLSLDLTGKGHEVAKRVWDSYEHMMAYVNDANDSAIAGNVLAVVSDADEKLNGLYLVKAIAGFSAAGEADDSVTETVVEKIGSGSGTITVETYSDATAQATADNVGQIIYVKTDSETGKAGTYVVTGKGALQKLATSSASGAAVETISGDDYITATASGNQVSLSLDKAKVIEGLPADFSLSIDKDATDGNTYLYLKSKDAKTTYAKVDASQFVVDGFLDKVELTGNNLVFTWNTTAGKEATTVDLSKYIDAYTAGSGLDLSDSNAFSVKVKEGEKYITVDADGLATKGIDDAISAAVDAKVIPTASVEKGDFVTVSSATTENNTAYTVGVTTATVASATDAADGLAKATDVKKYVDSAVAAGTGAIKLPTVTSADSFVSVSAVTAAGQATEYKVGVVTEALSSVTTEGTLADAKDVKDYVDGKVTSTLSWTEL